MKETNPDVDSKGSDSRREFVGTALMVLATIHSRTVWANSLQTPGSACGSVCPSSQTQITVY